MMIKTSVAIAVLSTAVALTGCDGRPERAQTVERNWLSISALPIIQDAVFELTPLFDGQRNLQAMGQLCALARREAKQGQVDAFLKQQGVNSAQIPKEGHPLSLLVNDDHSGQITACAAYLSTSVLSPVDLTELSRPAPDATRTAKPGGAPLQLDTALVNESLPVKLAEAHANADIFALIAVQLQRRPGLTIAEYRTLSRQLFSALAPTYLERVKEHFPSDGTQYKLVRVDDEVFSFISSAGDLFEFNAYDGLTLRTKGIVEYGGGKLLGQEYPVQVAYFTKGVEGVLDKLNH
jgi:hypothetical protein